MADTTQKTRRENLKPFLDDYHRSRYGDYDLTYSEFAGTYGFAWDDNDPAEDVCDICGEERRAKIHTDTELHPDDAKDGLELHAFEPMGDAPKEFQPIPKYASLHSDETYGMIHVFDTMREALADQVPDGSDTLSVPSGVIDLDTGRLVEHRMVALSENAYRLVCGLIHPEDKMDSDGVCADEGVWEEIRQSFPLDDFPHDANPDDNPPVFYSGDN